MGRYFGAFAVSFWKEGNASAFFLYAFPCAVGKPNVQTQESFLFWHRVGLFRAPVPKTSDHMVLNVYYIERVLRISAPQSGILFHTDGKIDTII